jgi:YD repeat-containing protein
MTAAALYEPSSLRPSSLDVRFLAALIDFLLVFFVALPFGRFDSRIAVWAVEIVVLWLYRRVFGATPGQQMVGILLMTAPGGTISTQYAYDPQDNLTSVTDPNGNVTSPARPAPSPPLALHIERSLVSMAKRGGTFVVRGGSGAIAGAQPISVEIKNLALGITVPVVGVGEEGAFEATVDAAPGDRLSMRAVSGIGEQIEIGLDQVRSGEPQAILGTRHSVEVGRLHLVSSLIAIPAAAAALLPRCDDCVTSQPPDQPRRRPARSEDAVQGVLRRRRKLTHTFKSFQVLCSRRLRS